jgi:hypothetical protein
MYIILLAVLVVVRYIEWKLFLKKLSKLCHDYDKKVVRKNGTVDYIYLVYFRDKNYFVYSEWSAWYFLYHKGGPDIYTMFFLPKRLTFDNIYDKQLLDRIYNYE